MSRSTGEHLPGVHRRASNEEKPRYYASDTRQLVLADYPLLRISSLAPSADAYPRDFTLTICAGTIRAFCVLRVSTSSTSTMRNDAAHARSLYRDETMECTLVNLRFVLVTRNRALQMSTVGNTLRRFRAQTLHLPCVITGRLS